MKTSLLLLFSYILTLFSSLYGNNIKNNDIFNSLLNYDILSLGNLLKFENINLYTRNNEGNTPLLSAIKLGQIDATRLIISYGGDIDDMTNQGSLKGMNSLMWACSQGHLEIVKLLLHAGVNLEEKMRNILFQGKTPLMWASSQGHTKIVSFLLNAGANISEIDNRGRTALIWAISQGKLETVITLLSHGDNPNKLDNEGSTPLMWASGKKNQDFIDYENFHESNIHIKHLIGGNSSIIKYLLYFHANVSIKDNYNLTALMYASIPEYQLDVLDSLIKAGANPYEVNHKGFSPIRFFKELPQPEVYHFLLKQLNILNRNPFELVEISVCSWILNVISYKSSLYLSINYNNNNNNDNNSKNITVVCDEISKNGLNISIWELLILLRSIPPNNILDLISFPTIGSKFRALSELNELSKKFQNYEDWLVPIFDRKQEFYF